MKTPLIISISSHFLKVPEKKYFKNFKPFGCIFFSRNIISIDQTKKLIKNIKILSPKTLIFVDQESGIVDRFKFCKNLKFMDNFKYYKLYLKDKKKAKYLVFLKSFITSYYLKNFGFDSNTVPVLDLPENNTSLFIKKRTFGPNLSISKVLNEIIILNTINHGLIPVIKHIPGHGVTSKDSHKVIPKSNHNMSELTKHFKSFNNFNYLPLAMTSHIVYKSIDDKNIATFSEAVINKIIRNKINFQGLLMSDDLSMKAVNYTPEAICNIANKIDIDILLDCSDDIDRYIYFSKNFIPKNRYKKFIKTKQVWHLKSNISQSINIDKYRDIYDNMI